LQQQYQSACTLIKNGGNEAQQGFQLLQKLASEGHVESTMALAKIKLDSSPPTFSPQSAFELLQSIENKDSTGLASYLTGEALSILWGGNEWSEADNLEWLNKIQQHFVKGAEKGHVDAMLQLAYGYREGVFLHENINDLGYSWLLQAAKTNHPRACFELGLCLLHGIGCAVSVPQAKIYFNKAAEYNYPNAAALARTDDIPGSRSSKRHALYHQPEIVELSAILSPMECSYLVVLSLPYLQPSKVISFSGVGKSTEGRTSFGTSFPKYRRDFVVINVIKKLCKVAGISIQHTENLVLLKYGEGDQYRVHADYFNDELEGHRQFMGPAGQRVKTIVCYLNTVEQGGGTEFPNLDLRVKAIAGNAVMFENAKMNGEVYVDSRHAGLPVLKGSKWIVTLWFRQNPFMQ